MARIQLVPLEGGVERAASDTPTPMASVLAAEMLASVEHALAEMKPELAEVFRLRTTSDLPFKQIAARQGVSINTALGRMHQAVKKIHRVLAERDLLPERGTP